MSAPPTGRTIPGTGVPWRVAGRIRAGGVERDVTFADADPGVQADIDAAYHAKYDRYGPQVVGHGAHRVTVRLLPQAAKGLPSDGHQ